MPSYTLNIEFDNAGLDKLTGAQQTVTLVKAVAGGRPTTWLTFFPQQSNTVTWTDVYSVYSSTTAINHGAKIITASSSVADGGKTYKLSSGHFDSGTTDLDAGTYGVFNNDHRLTINGIEMVTAGLYQGAVVNGESTTGPLNAVGLPFNQTAQFTPVEKIQVFSSYHTDNGLVISSVMSHALTVDLTQQRTQTIHFHNGTSQFSLGAL